MDGLADALLAPFVGQFADNVTGKGCGIDDLVLGGGGCANASGEFQQNLRTLGCKLQQHPPRHTCWGRNWPGVGELDCDVDREVMVWALKPNSAGIATPLQESERIAHRGAYSRPTRRWDSSGLMSAELGEFIEKVLLELHRHAQGIAHHYTPESAKDTVFTRNRVRCGISIHMVPRGSVVGNSMNWGGTWSTSQTPFADR